MTAAPAKRIRRAPADLRAEALAAARRLIVEGKEPVLTMRAVADAIGVTYPNLSHHFGSAAGLHAAIAEDLVRELLDNISAIGREMEHNDSDFTRLVDRVFDLFDRDGLGHVIGWLVRSGDNATIEPVRALLADFIDERRRRAGEASGKRIAEIALIITFAAYAEASAGTLLGLAFGVDADQRRAVVASALNAVRNTRLLTGT
ncbi:AcrR family transcriptional regulator [Caulobacter ginsengisoli]|uniref:AcrR family transcriptional regulator n=1 Tax=Caulobacter ginsengisoli TaxID=400775 RepID=A0ABU0ITT6_9CAUL|nr:TetR/AcrR family transcriptional regulator [Caulobacter ginsengisoli]MDQ0464835.1 AcrR family transcriptional regulator [Caulobacter ginsengisoli]